MNESQYKRKEAIALSYNPSEHDGPTVTAKGKGKIADNILEQAMIHDVPIYEDPNLVQLLGQLDLNQAIPEELYQAVAEVFAFIYRLDKDYHALTKKNY